MRERVTAPDAAAPAVSVVLPVFNRLEYLRPAVESVFAQTFTDWELIVADDGSDGETRDYLGALCCPPRVSVIWLSHCGNPAAVRNAALAAARGEYVAFLDSDDLWLPLKLERQVAALRAHRKRHWCYSGYLRIDAAGELQPRPGYERRVRHQGAILEPLLQHAVDIWTPAVVVQRSLLVQLGGFDEQLLLFEDYDLWLRLATRSEIELVDEPLIAVRTHDQHYSPGDRGASMLASRHRSLLTLARLLTDRQLHTRVGRMQARSTLDLAAARAESDRPAAVRTVMRGWRCWRYGEWWTGLPRVLLKLLVPRALLDAYRRSRRPAGRPVTKTPQSSVTPP